MSGSPACFILDVGHGNAAVVTGSEGVVIVDGGAGGGLLNFLDRCGITKIRSVLVSHADADHISGLIAILSRCLSDPGFEIETIHINPDPRKSDLFTDLIGILYKLDNNKRSKWITSIGTDSPEPMDLRNCLVEVIAPSKIFRARGIGGKRDEDRKSTANSLSAVVRVTQNGSPWVLLPGDLDRTGMKFLVEDGQVAKAPVIVFPHHGGNGGSDTETVELVEEIRRECEHHSVIFSARNGDPRFPNRLVAESLISCSPIPNVYCIGNSPTFEEVSKSVEMVLHNMTGTLVIDGLDESGVPSISRLASKSEVL
ncbi:MBL fold metallo-hydrolase [Stenotrophomonas maltophilia]|uniref:MBL fold metallo-hydrolase n=1 Tax=Stenotrophomonas maltophilia TaxID=40324 RepID=UPI0013DD3B21|nr:MBL fold metallo-hydrolase [Stenotrophomonas maltophilia]